ncbi:MAG: DinB family protein, partial [Gemmatimonadota bacterium]
DYWPKSKEPTTPNAWDESVAAVKRDRAEFQRLAEKVPDLFATIPWGTGQTYARELILVIDHNAYHVGQIIIVRRSLGAWPS